MCPTSVMLNSNDLVRCRLNQIKKKEVSNGTTFHFSWIGFSHIKSKKDTKKKEMIMFHWYIHVCWDFMNHGIMSDKKKLSKIV